MDETKKWIDEEFEKWRHAPCYNPFGIDDDGHWYAKSFALHISKETLKHSQTKDKSNSVPEDDKTSVPEKHNQNE